MPTSDTIPLLLVRTGATEWDDARRVQGLTDLPLSSAGSTAVTKDLGEYVEQTRGSAWSGFDVLLHSPDEASRQTAKILNGLVRTKAKAVEDLHPMDMGLWEGLREADLLERHPTAYERWREDPTAVTPPEGESLTYAEDRLLGGLRRSLARRSSAAVVLRPPAFGILRCWLSNRPLTDLWPVLADAPSAELFVVERSRLKSLPTRAATRA